MTAPSATELATLPLYPGNCQNCRDPLTWDKGRLVHLLPGLLGLPDLPHTHPAELSGGR